MFSGYGRLRVLVTISALIAADSLVRAVPQQPEPLSTDRFPAGTELVYFAPHHDRTYFATQEAVGEHGTGARFALKERYGAPESIDISADGRRLIVRFAYESLVLQASSLRLLRHLDTPWVWWEGSRLGYLSTDDSDHDYILTRGRESRVSLHRTRIILADPKGRYFLGARLISRDTRQDGYASTYRLQLWERNEGGRLRLRRDLETTRAYEPGHAGGGLSHLAALNDRLAVFGSPAQVDNELVGVLQGRRVIVPLANAKGRPLEFGGSPVITEKAIAGLASSLALPHYLPSGDRYFYRVTKTSTILRPVRSNVAFVTYNPKRGAIGLGIADKDGVCVKYVTIKSDGSVRLPAR